MLRNMHQEESASSSPVISNTEETSAPPEQTITEQTVETQPSPEEVKVSVAYLTRLVRRHFWFGQMDAISKLAFASVLVLFLTIYIVLSFEEGHALRVVLDLKESLPSFIGSDGQEVFNIGGVLPLGLAMMVSSLLASMKRRRSTNMIDVLINSDDVRVVSPMVEALFLPDKAIRSRVAVALTSLLPRLRREDGEFLGSNQRVSLLLYLGRSRTARLPDDDALTLAILQAFEQVGDGSELPIVKRMAQGKNYGARNLQVQEAARSYLEEQKRRADVEKQSQTLLRASSETNTPSEVLLRPSGSVAETDPQQLLRATPPDDRP